MMTPAIVKPCPLCGIMGTVGAPVKSVPHLVRTRDGRIAHARCLSEEDVLICDPTELKMIRICDISPDLYVRITTLLELLA